MHFSKFLPSREVSVLAGASGSGKSTLLLQFLKSWSDGRSFLDVPPPSDGVSYLAGDRSINSLYHRAKDVGIDMTTIPHTSLIDNSDIDIKMFQYDALSLLFRLLDSLKGPLFMIDPLIIFLGVDLNRYHLVAPQLIRLNRHCQDRGYTILGTHHTTKARSDFQFMRPQDRISGSSALSAFTSTQLALTSPDEVPQTSSNLPPAARLDIVSHIAAPETHWLSRDDKGLFTPMGPDADKALQTAGVVGLAIYQSVPAGSAVTAPDILSTLDGVASRATVYRHLEKLVDGGLLQKESRGSYTRPGASNVLH